jgi:hypothetical protein
MATGALDSIMTAQLPPGATQDWRDLWMAQRLRQQSGNRLLVIPDKTTKSM